MQRVTMSLDETLAEAFDALIDDQGYTSRSEAMRDLLRKAVETRRAARVEGHCVASLSFVYNHHVRALSQRLTEIGHAHHDLVVSTMHVHLDHENCLETSVIKGDVARVRAFADSLWAERGVSFGELNIITVKPDDGTAHGAGVHQHAAGGQHLTPVHAPGRGRA